MTEFARPSYLLRMLHEKFPARFGEILGLGDEAKLSDFWGRMLPNSIELRSHPCFRGTGPANWTRIVPLTLHEDAGPYSKKKSTNVVSFNGLFGTGGEKLCQFVICSWIKEGHPSPGDLAAFWDPIMADFNELAVTGMGRWKLFILLAKGDMEQRSVGWGLPSYNSEEPCTECRANRTNLPFTDLRADSRWRTTELASTASFLNRARRPLHPLLSSSFVWRGLFPLDIMHLLDCNGVTNIIGGSLIRGLVLSERRLGGTQEERMNEINRRMAVFLSERPGTPRMPP